MTTSRATSRNEALALGLPRFFTGRPCKQGHVAERQARSGNCLECHNARGRNVTDREPQRAANRASYNKHREERQQAHNAWYQANTEKHLADTAAYREENRTQVRSHDRKRNRQRFTGFSPKHFERVLDEQAGLCAICCEPLVPGRFTHADHCHVTDATRGVLCRGCNVGLGFLKDSPETLRAAADYIERWRKT